MRGFVNCHFFVHLFKVQVLKVHSDGMLGEIPSQELETSEVPAEEDGVVLLRQLEGLHRLRSNRLDFLFRSQKLLVLLQSQLSLHP